MSITAHLPVLAVIVPLAGGAVAFLAGVRSARGVALATAALTAGITGWLVADVLASGPRTYAVGGWGGPLGIVLVADGLSATFLLLMALIGAAVTLYATGYFERATEDRPGPGHGLFWTLWLFMWASLNALLLAGDVFNVYVCLELVGLSAVALVTLTEGPDALRAGMRYLFAGILGAMTYLLGVALLYASVGVLDMALIAEALRDDTLRTAATAQTGLALMVVALLLKTALVPVHFWLPSAHSAAPSPVSAALSALVVKGSFVVLMRLFVDIMPPGFLGEGHVLLGVLGAVAIVWGSLQALVQKRLKLLVAYSTVAQVGYLFLLFPFAAEGGTVFELALLGVVAHAAAHGLAKAAMFLASGAVLKRYGHDRIKHLAGAVRRTPVIAATYALAGVTMMGLPPSGGFAAKWLVGSAALASGQWWWAAVVVTGGLLAAAYMFRLLGVMLTEPENASEPLPSHAPARLEWLPLALAAASCVLVFAIPALGRMVAASGALAGAGGVLP